MRDEDTEAKVLHWRIESLVQGQERMQQQQKEMHDRVDAKLDKLADAMTYLAQHEERLTAHYENQKRLAERQDAADARMDGFDVRLREVEGPSITEAVQSMTESTKQKAKQPGNAERALIGAGGIVLGAVILKGLGL